jgi:hypothetical protein
MLEKPIVYASVPVISDDVGFRKSFIMAQDRVILGGPPGFRAMNRYRLTNEAAQFDP